MPKFNWESASLQAWTKVQHHVNLIFTRPLSGKSTKQQCAYLLLWLGGKGQHLFSTWRSGSEETDKLDVYLEKFREHIAPVSYPRLTYYKFHKHDQLEHESIEHYITALEMLVKDCELTGDFEKAMLRDRLICGLKLHRTREKLLSQCGILDLDRAVTIARAVETSQEQLMLMSGTSKPHTTINEPN